MSALLKCYDRLLTDISIKSEVHLCAPDNLGIYWVTISGPALDKQLLHYLEHEDFLIEPTYCMLFPEWLKPLWDRYLQTKDAVFIKYMRQVLVFGYKAEFEPTDKQIEEAQASFVNTDEEIAEIDTFRSFNNSFWKSARKLISRITGGIDYTKIVPFHGPGAVFPPFDPVSRSCFTTIHTKIQQHYDFWTYFRGMPGFIPSASEIHSEEIVESTSPIRGKLVFVPKDSRGPRSICVHPRESIWIQQGQRVLLERSAVRVTNHHINFDDQTVNGSIALASSLSREYCTLDLKDASDRLGCKVVEFLFGSHYPILSCTRMEEVILPDGRVVTLNKWATMGNALCFPVESCVFYALARTGIEVVHGSNAAREVYVFGDDIIVPSKYVAAAMEGLWVGGLLVNQSKTFYRGFFRESCGVDAFKGLNVTPLRMKKHKISTSLDLIAFCAFAKNARIAGYEFLASYMYSLCRQYLRSHGDRRLPINNDPEAGGVVEYMDKVWAYIVCYNHPSDIRWNNGLHRYEVRTLLARASTTRSHGDWYHLQDSLLSLERRAKAREGDSNILFQKGQVYPVPYRSKLKTGWTRVC